MEPIKSTLVKFLEGYVKKTKEHEDYLKTLSLMVGFLPEEQEMLVKLLRSGGNSGQPKKILGIF